MRRAATDHEANRAGRIAGVAVLIALVLGLGLCASSAALHQKLCPYAGTPGDSCAVAAFAAGLVTASPVPVIVAAVVWLVVGAILLSEVSLPPTPLYRLSPSRAPPAGGLVLG
jgi:hypothetical protein